MDSDERIVHTGHYLRCNHDMRSSLSKIKFDDTFILIRDESKEECPFSDGNGFLHGICNIFALALHREFGYDIYEVVDKDKKSIHWFGLSSFNNHPIYIDVRGATTDFDEFFSEFQKSAGDNYQIVQREEQDCGFSEDWSETGLLFAIAVIRENYDDYKC